MYLSKDEERILKGEYGYAKQKAMEILVALGDLYEAERLIPISSAQIAGVSYTSIGDEGLEWIENLFDGRVEVLSTLNPLGMDLDRWNIMGIPMEYASKQVRIVEAYMKLGILPICTCTPYLSGNLPTPGSHIAWSESSAVVFANSVLKAKTNREGGPSALAAALIGKTPFYGLHLDENRRPSVSVKVEMDLEEVWEYSVLGFYIGRILKGGVIPFIEGLKECNLDKLKAVSAAMASTGGLNMFTANVLGDIKPIPCETLSFDYSTLKEVIETLPENITDRGSVDIVCLGCPHLSLEELNTIAYLLKGRRVKGDVKLWLFTSRAVYSAAERCGLVDEIVSVGGEIYRDACPALAPLSSIGYKVMATDSLKMWFYGRHLAGVKTLFLPTIECISTASR
ncbi:MAG: aconitase X catalytic domain-containing protein [Nitrososphaerota archaeon]|nr:aconitase X catalytic domain-containing protein [Candidatus Bathyarchaeota archaeon]MCX8162538.1 aconitase X catalytic domain-containing protein [Candidatus Bathyarchaeota archaeon]MDW8061802.1 aconitase X catalytic domain-containing protein [Nitrososphaerota archaeon]